MALSEPKGRMRGGALQRKSNKTGQVACLSLFVSLLLAANGWASDTPSMFAAKRAATAYTLDIAATQSVAIPGATAAWAVDANVIDVAVRDGVVTLFARAAGRTRVIVLTSHGEQALDVIVAGRKVAAAAQTRRESHGVAETRYSSAAHEMQNNVSVTHETKTKRIEARVQTAHYPTETFGDRARTTVPSATIRVFTRGRELTLLDRDVDHSPLTLSHTPVRGAHYLDARWRLHAGYTAYAAYRSFLVPVEREWIAGAAYRFGNARSSLTPGFFAYRGAGTVASLLYDHTDADRLTVRTELAYSRGVGVAAQLAYQNGRQNARADIRYRPDDFAVATAGSPRGLIADAYWNREYGRGSTAALTFAASDVANTRVVAASADGEHRLSDRFALTGGVSAASFDGHRGITLPAGVRFDYGRGGFGATYRYTESGSDRGGHGGRLFGRASLGRLFVSGYVDRQQFAPTLEVIFDEKPELALALSELGITATSPADIARALRENAALIELGFIEGVTVDLAPLRTQAGLELTWLGSGVSRQQLRLHVTHRLHENVSTAAASTIATVAYSRRLTNALDLTAAYTWWRTERRGEETRVMPYFDVSLRRRFDALPSFGGGTISGVVYADEDLDGASDGTPVTAEVELDGAKKMQTGADGKFAFTNVGRGSHRVVARLPDRPDAYFTTASRVDAEAGDKLAFGVASTPARLIGRVVSDAGDGIASVRVLLARGSQRLVETTDEDGRFSFATPPGEWQLSLLPDSVPAGYSLGGSDARAVMLERAKPAASDITLRAHRTLSGSGAPANAELEIRPLAKRVRADAQGRFTVRSLPAGEVTIVAGAIEHRLTFPGGPAALTLDLGAAAAERALPVVRTIATGERHEPLHSYAVAIGAFRVKANAEQAAARARRTGVAATVAASGSLSVVRAGPFESRAEASAAAEKLTRVGLDAVIMSTK